MSYTPIGIHVPHDNTFRVNHLSLEMNYTHFHSVQLCTCKCAMFCMKWNTGACVYTCMLYIYISFVVLFEDCVPL